MNSLSRLSDRTGAAQRRAIARLAALLGKIKGSVVGTDDDDDDHNLPRPNATVPTRLPRLTFALAACS